MKFPFLCAFLAVFSLQIIEVSHAASHYEGDVDRKKQAEVIENKNQRLERLRWLKRSNKRKQEIKSICGNFNFNRLPKDILIRLSTDWRVSLKSIVFVKKVSTRDDDGCEVFYDTPRGVKIVKISIFSEHYRVFSQQ